MNFCFLAYPHMFQLRFFEVRRDPYLVQGNHRQHLFARIDIQSHHDFLRHFTTNRSKYFGVPKVQFGLVEFGLLLPFVGNGR